MPLSSSLSVARESGTKPFTAPAATVKASPPGAAKVPPALPTTVTTSASAKGADWVTSMVPAFSASPAKSRVGETK